MKKAEGSDKKEHMCDLLARKASVKELKAVARGARYMCIECGRSAKARSRLCVYEAL